MKYLLVLIVVAVGAAWWRSQQAPAARSKSVPPRRAAPENMVACAHCGVHLPRSEALVQDGKFYCSAAPLPRSAPDAVPPR